MERSTLLLLRSAAIAAWAVMFLTGCASDMVTDAVAPLAVMVRKFPTAEHQPPSQIPGPRTTLGGS